MYRKIFILLLLFIIYIIHADVEAVVPSKHISLEAEQLIFDKIAQRTEAIGDVKFTSSNYILTAKKVTYYHQTGEVIAEEDVVLKDQKMRGIYFADKAHFNIKNNQMQLERVQWQVGNVKIAAKSMQSKSDGSYTGQMITTSLCNLCDNKQQIAPLWQVRAKKLTTNIGTNEEVKLSDVYIDIRNTQLIHVPYFAVPTLWTRGKTGFLTPKFVYNPDLGFEVFIPFYWNPIKNLDFTFTQSMNAKPIYNLNMRHKLQKGGYEFTIITAQLPFIYKMHTTSKHSIFRTWPANIKFKANFLHKKDLCSLQKKAYELGLNGEMALGARPILLYKYNLSENSILLGRAYFNFISNNYLLSANINQFHDLRNEKRLISMPKSDFIKITQKNNATYIVQISTNNLYNETFSQHTSDILAESKVIFKKTFRNHNFILQPKALAYQVISNSSSNKHIVQPSTEIHWYKTYINPYITTEPHIVLHMQPQGHNTYSIDDSIIARKSDNFDDTSLSIYSTTNMLNPNNVFSTGIYSTGNRSINTASDNYLDYGFILAKYQMSDSKHYLRKIIATFVGRQHLSKKNPFISINQSADFSNAQLHNIFNDKYAIQLDFMEGAFVIKNKTWFTNNLKLSNNEMYFYKEFTKMTAGFKYLFFDRQTNFMPTHHKEIYNKLVKTDIKYDVTKNLLFGVQNTFSISDNSTKFKQLKLKLEYFNECLLVGFSMKKDFSGRFANDQANIYKIYFKIPQIT